jgi:hypothetical protein
MRIPFYVQQFAVEGSSTASLLPIYAANTLSSPCHRTTTR